MKASRLGWYGYVKRGGINDQVKKIEINLRDFNKRVGKAEDDLERKTIKDIKD